MKTDLVPAHPGEPRADSVPARRRAEARRAARWSRRAEKIRDQEWEMAQQLLDTARTLLRRILLLPVSATSLAEITRLLELASRLGRVSTGLESGRTEVTGAEDRSLDIEWERALKKVYGRPRPAEVIEAQLVTDSKPLLTPPTASKTPTLLS